MIDPNLEELTDHELTARASADGCGDPHLEVECSCGWSHGFKQFEKGTVAVEVPWLALLKAVDSHGDDARQVASRDDQPGY